MSLTPESPTEQAAQQETDALIATVMEQIDTLTFDPDDYPLLQRLVHSFSDKRGMVRLRIAETLGEIGEPATPVLVAALRGHADPVVRRACAKTLTLIADPTAIPALRLALLEDEDTVVKGSSAGALARMGEAAVPTLFEILESPDYSQSLKGHAAWALAFIGAEAKEHLYRAISSELPDVRVAVVGAIAKAAQEEPESARYELLLDALSDPVEAVRVEAAAVLGNLSYRPAIPRLLEMLQHPEAETRKAAALSLMNIPESSVLEPLRTALEQETEIQPILKLAVTQLERKLGADDWD